MLFSMSSWLQWALQVLMEAVTYWHNFTMNIFSLIPLDFGRQNLIIQIPSANFQYQELFFYSFCTGHHFHSSFKWILLLRQEKPHCLKDKYFSWQVSSTLSFQHLAVFFFYKVQHILMQVLHEDLENWGRMKSPLLPILFKLANLRQ